MQIGILQCDNVRSSLSPDYGEYPEMFEKALSRINNATDNNNLLTFRVYCAHEGIFPDTPEECDAYLITGSRFSVLDIDELWIHQLQNFIVRLNKAMIKTIGVCFGHQIMAIAMGGKVERADCGWQIGVHTNNITQTADFMTPPASTFNIAMFCEDQVVKVGDTTTVLAEAKHCEYAMLQYGDHMLSVQGHPEFSVAFAKALLNVRQEEFPRKRFEIGTTSFTEQTLDGDLVFKWFFNFFTSS